MSKVIFKSSHRASLKVTCFKEFCDVIGGPTCRRDDVPPDGGALEEQEEDAEEPDDDVLSVLPGQLGVAVANLSN